MSRKRNITVEVNGRETTAEIPVRKLLCDFIREDAGWTGTHIGCEHGVCGACTVLVDGRGARSCLMFAVQAEGRKVRTRREPGVAREPEPASESLSGTNTASNAVFARRDSS